MGDFSGNVHKLNVKQYDMENYPQISVGMPIRSIGHSKQALIGTMDGNMYGWNHDGNQDAIILDNLGHSITCIRTIGYFYFIF